MSKFSELVKKLKAKGKSEEQSEGIAAKVGRAKYGKKNFQGAAAKSESVESYMKSKSK